MKKNIIIGIGEILWDMLPSGKRVGGAPVNFVYHASQAGADGYAISQIGNDRLGAEIISELEKNKIKYIVRESNFPTSTVEVELENGIPTYKIIENVAWDDIEVTPYALDVAKKCNVICFGTLALRSNKSKEGILSLIDAAPNDALKVFDINLRQDFFSKELIEELLKKSNVFKINDVELAILRQLFSLKGTDEKVCDKLLQEYNLKYLIYTVGDKYSVIYAPDDCTLIETPKVKVADTIGAGDAFAATFIQSVLNGKPQLEAHKDAVAVAAFVCTKAGAWPKYNRKKIEEIRNSI